MEAMENSGISTPGAFETTPPASSSQARPRGALSAFLRSVSNQLATLFAARDSAAVVDVAIDSENNMDDNTSALSSNGTGHERQDDLFEQFEVSRATVEAIQGVLRPLLKDFMVMHRDVITEMQSAAPLAAEGNLALSCNEAAPPKDQLEVFFRLVIILGVIILGTAHNVV
jgi:hypothetical protein